LLLVVRVGNMGGRICFRFKCLSMAFRKSGKPGQDVCMVFLGKNLLKRTLLCISFFVMVDCIFVSECLNRLIVSEFGFVLQLG